MTRAQANAEAWRRMVEAFPPLPKPEVPDAGQDDAPAEVAEMLDRLDDCAARSSARHALGVRAPGAQNSQT